MKIKLRQEKLSDGEEDAVTQNTPPKLLYTDS